MWWFSCFFFEINQIVKLSLFFQFHQKKKLKMSDQNYEFTERSNDRSIQSFDSLQSNETVISINNANEQNSAKKWSYYDLKIYCCCMLIILTFIFVMILETVIKH